MISFVALSSISQFIYHFCLAFSQDHQQGRGPFHLFMQCFFPSFVHVSIGGGVLIFTVLICQSSSPISARPSGSDSKEFACNMVWSLGWEDPLEKGMATHSRIAA